MLTAILYILLGLNLVKLLMEKTNTVFKDVRFWLVIASLLALVWMTLQSYPVD